MDFHGYREVAQHGSAVVECKVLLSMRGGVKTGAADPAAIRGRITGEKGSRGANIPSLFPTGDRMEGKVISSGKGERVRSCLLLVCQLLHRQGFLRFHSFLSDTAVSFLGFTMQWQCPPFPLPPLII